MSKCGGLHCPGCADGGGGLVLVVVVLAILAAAVHAAWHAIVTALEIAAYAVCAAAAAAAIGALVYLATSVRARHVAQDLDRRVIPARAEIVELGPPWRPAIDAPPVARADAWPLPGQWEEIHLDDDRRSS
jgi:hypothetical protein